MTPRLDPSQYGAVSETYSYVALFIIYTFGMETAYFRFVRKTEGGAYYSAGTAVLLISVLLSGLLAVLANPSHRLLTKM